MAEENQADQANNIEEAQDASDKEKEAAVVYKLEDIPPISLTLGLGLQHYLTMFGSTVSIPFILAGPLCIKNNFTAISELISTIFFASGISTLLQTTFGVRLPIVQGGTFSLIAPTVALMSLDKWQQSCHEFNSPIENLTMEQQANQTEMWRSRMREVQGAIIISSLFQVFLGFTGLIGLCLRFIGPLTVAPTIILVGLPLITAITNNASSQWGIAILTACLVMLFSQYLERFPIPFPAYNRTKKCHFYKLHMFRLFPVLLAIIFAWMLCAILTAANVFSDDPKVSSYLARTDTRISVITTSPWVRFPYPFQWGTPTISVAGVFGMLAGIVASIIESVGDYYACANLAGARPPPRHAISRGIGIEGIGSVLAGMLGTGNGTTSYSQNIGAIGITKVGSRIVVQCGAVIMIILGIFSKFGALFATIPNPIVGGIFIAVFGMVTAVGISNLQHCNMNSSRNIFIVGFSIMFGLAFPNWLKAGKNAKIIATGVTELDQIFRVFLSTNMAVGGLIALILDNTIPGTLKERGLLTWLGNDQNSSSDDETIRKELKRAYDLPFGITNFLNRCSCTKYLPFCPPHYPDNNFVTTADGVQQQEIAMKQVTEPNKDNAEQVIEQRKDNDHTLQF